MHLHKHMGARHALARVVAYMRTRAREARARARARATARAEGRRAEGKKIKAPEGGLVLGGLRLTVAIRHGGQADGYGVLAKPDPLSDLRLIIAH